MGTGKTKVCIDTAAKLYREREIDGLMVLAPNSVHFNWKTDELPAHLPDDLAERARVHVYQTSRSGTLWHKNEVRETIRHDGLAVMLMSYNAVMTDAGRNALWSMLKKRRCLYVLDESAMIKSPSAKRTTRVVASGAYAPYRRVLNGTPVANGPFDVYSQLRFLDPGFWLQHDIGSAQVFRHTFGEFVRFTDGNGREQEFVKRYRQLNVLHDWLKPVSSRVLKEDVLDLPPKLYTKRYFELTGEQRRVYDELKDEFMVELEGGHLTTAPLIIQRMTRFQQITGGYLPSDDGRLHRFEQNPRLGVLEEFRDECPHQAIVWAERTEDVDLIMATLGRSAARHDGKCSDEQREQAKTRFKSGDAKWFVAKPSVGGMGLTLTQAGSVFFYNTSFNLLQRQQAEDRAHRYGLDHPVTYVDSIARNTLDEAIIRSLREKFDVGTQVTGDRVREWL
ncbi:MAG: SNF2-related protein [Pseudonocardiaceae bacterium]